MSGGTLSGILVEALVSRRPVVVRRRVRWGECDPAGVVYTPRFADYAVSALEHFVASLLGDPPQARLVEMGIRLPLKGMTMEFRRSLYSEQDFYMAVGLGEIRNRTFDLTVEGLSAAGDSLFLFTLSPICVAAGERVSVAIPAVLRRSLEEYRDLFPVPAAGLDLPRLLPVAWGPA